MLKKSRAQRPERLTQECQSITEHHGWPQVVDEIQIGKAASLAVIPEEPARPTDITAAVPGTLRLSTFQTAPGNPTLAEPTCLTPAWQKRHLWLECSRRGQSPGDCCGQLSWLKSYKCCELCRWKEKRQTFHLTKYSIPELCWGRSSLPTSSQPCAASPKGSKYSFVGRTGNRGL